MVELLPREVALNAYLDLSSMMEQEGRLKGKEILVEALGMGEESKP